MNEKQEQSWWPFVFDEKAADVARKNRALYKWVLDFFRNVMVVAALAYVAQKSGSYLVWSFAILANFALCAYCYTYVELWTVRGELLVSRGVRGKLLGFFVLAIIQLILMGISMALFFAVNTIVTAQQAH